MLNFAEKFVPSKCPIPVRKQWRQAGNQGEREAVCKAGSDMVRSSMDSLTLQILQGFHDLRFRILREMGIGH